MHPSSLITILTIRILSFHIGVNTPRPKILSFTDGCWPFQQSKTVAWGRGKGEGGEREEEGEDRRSRAKENRREKRRDDERRRSRARH